MPRFVRYLNSEADANGYPNLGATLTVTDAAQTGLTNGVEYRVALVVPGPSGIPAAALTTPVHLGSIASGTNTAVASFAATNPAYSIGDLVVVNVAIDGGPGIITGGVTMTPPNGETVNTEVALFANGNDNQLSQSIIVFSYIAGATVAQGANITINLVAPSSTNQISAVVTAWDAGTFKATAPYLANKVGTGSAVNVDTVPTASFTAASPQAIVCAFINTAANPTTSVPAGWTSRADVDPGASPVRLLTRNSATTGAEAVASVSLAVTATTFNAITYVVLPFGAA